MATQPGGASQSRNVSSGGRFRPLACLLGLPAAAALGAVAAWLAVGAQFYFAPLLLFPLLVGLGVGAACVGLMRLTQVGNRPTIVLGVLLAAAVAVAGQHYLDYRQALARSLHEIEALQRSGPVPITRLPAAPPQGFADYLRQQADAGRPVTAKWSVRGWRAWLSWAVDGLLVVAAALAMAIPAARLPYCNTCRTWYRTMRAGRTPLAAARKMARLAAAAIDAPVKRVRYRLSCCQGGCGPTRLELFWESGDGGEGFLEAWLDAAQRDAAMQALDEGSRMKDQG